MIPFSLSFCTHIAPWSLFVSRRWSLFVLVSQVPSGSPSGTGQLQQVMASWVKVFVWLCWFQIVLAKKKSLGMGQKPSLKNRKNLSSRIFTIWAKFTGAHVNTCDVHPYIPTSGGSGAHRGSGLLECAICMPTMTTGGRRNLSWT